MRRMLLDMEELREAWLDAMLPLAFALMDALDAERLASGGEADVRAEDIDAARRAYDRFRAKAGAARLPRRRERGGRALAARAVVIAACVVLLMAALIPIAVANVPLVRRELLRILTDRQDEALSFSITRSPMVEVPELWRGDWYPTYIPADFAVDAEGWSCANRAVVYRHPGGATIIYTEYGESVRYTPGTDDARVLEEDVNGAPATVVERPAPALAEDWTGPWETDVVWEADGVQFEVNYVEAEGAETDGTTLMHLREEALAVARSVTRLEGSGAERLALQVADVPSDGTAPVPKGWRGEAYPAWIPDGYVFQDISAQVTDEVFYARADGGWLEYAEYGDGASLSFFTGEAEVSHETVGGAEASLLMRQGAPEEGGYAVDVIWEAGDRLYTVHISAPEQGMDADRMREDALAVARSVRPVG